MTTAPFRARFGAALLAATAATILTTGLALAHPESEGDHPSGCVVTAEPGTVAPGGQFTVSGNFGGAWIYVLPGPDATPTEGGQPTATTPAGSTSFSLTFTALGPGDITVIAVIAETECADTDHVTVTAAVPNTAMDEPSAGVIIVGLALLLAAVVGARRLRAV